MITPPHRLSIYIIIYPGAGDAPVSEQRRVAVDPVSAANRAANIGEQERQMGAVSSERARLVEEYRERQRQAMLNKVILRPRLSVSM